MGEFPPARVEILTAVNTGTTGNFTETLHRRAG